MYTNEKEVERVILCGIHTDNKNQLIDTTTESMRELEELAHTAGAEVLAVMVQNRERPETSTYFGEGKLEELKLACESLDANLVIFDTELTGMQIRNIEKEINVRTIDRSMLILDIFAKRALSKEGKIQVELAQLRYSLPRLTGMGIAMSRLGAGIGTRGPGETKLESDRRHIHRRISYIESELDEIIRHRTLIRNRREKDNTVTAALVGYTNAGKSTLMNALTNADVYVQDQLFATLDTTVRSLDLPDGRNAVLVDTVGFIRKLPHHLIDAFKSTLEEAVTADVLLHVIDSSSDEIHNQMQIVDNLLSELGCKAKHIIAVFNKCDVAPPLNPRPSGNYTHFIEVSAKTGEGIDKLIALLDETLPGKKKEITVLIPYSNTREVSILHDSETILTEEYTDNGVLIKLLADEKLYAHLKEYLI